jgi:hypothetical protein
VSQSQSQSFGMVQVVKLSKRVIFLYLCRNLVVDRVSRTLAVSSQLNDSDTCPGWRKSSQPPPDNKELSCICQWGILSLLIDTQAKQTHSTQAGTAARQWKSTRERGSRTVPTDF